ncbi:MAG: hypothetical protein LHV69_00575 [Elusimicrobia bacterium]|nr:hypothetical protein [Candidatus Obscuribacterium magneticum]
MILLLGYALGDRSFAVLNLSQFTGLPIFITEPVLFILLLRGAITTAREKTFSKWMLDWKSPWLWFYAIGLLNIFRGLLVDHWILALRDAMLVFYGLITQIVITYVKTPNQVKRIYFTVLLGLLVRYALHFRFEFFSPSTIAWAMYASVVVLGGFYVWFSQKKHRLILLSLTSFFLYTIVTSGFRTVWVSVFLAYFVMAFSLRILKMSLRPFWFLCLITIISLTGTIVIQRSANRQNYQLIKTKFLSFFWGIQSPNVITRIAMWEDSIQAVIPATKPLFDTLDRITINPYLFRSKERLAKIPTGDKLNAFHYAAQHNASSVTQMLEKFESKASGKTPMASPHLKENLDAAASSAPPTQTVSAKPSVVPEKPAEPKPLVVPEKSAESKPAVEPVKPSPTPISQPPKVEAAAPSAPPTQPVTAKPPETSEKPAEPKPAFEPVKPALVESIKLMAPFDKCSNHQLTKLFIGVPFGVRFIPGRIIGYHNIDRYDSHNSLIAILYRTGLAGIVLFFWMVGREMVLSFRVAQKTQWREQKEIILGLLCAFSYHVFHSMTDVTLENPFKGGVFWLLLGLLIVVRSFKNTESRSE